jgi:predicted RNase H-like HicB family nuclease
VKAFQASVWKEDGIFVAQCLDVDVASQGPTEDEALESLKEALELHYTAPVATSVPRIATLEVDIGAA